MTDVTMSPLEPMTDLGVLRRQVRDWKRVDLRVGFVPTMGNLHAGHFALVRALRKQCDRVVASVFVNPTQFGPDEDFARYPRTADADALGLAGSGCDLLWMPSVPTMYPMGLDATVQVRVPGITSVLEGAHRPGHFDGVATVVARLFNQVQADVAAFGRKDYQQVAVIRHLVRELSVPLELLVVATERDADGLALSSRNQYLSPSERSTAPVIHRTLLAMRDASRAGAPREAVERDACDALESAGLVPDYAVIRTPDLLEPLALDGPRVALIAARLGRTRLIDNLEFDI